MKDHKDLDVWIQSMLLVEDIYALTKNFPSNEKYGLSSQIKRAVVSIPSNIAEGAGRKGDKEFIQLNDQYKNELLNINLSELSFMEILTFY